MKLLKGKNKMFFIFLFVIAVIVTGGLYFILVGNMTDVLVLNQTARGGTQITAEMLSVKKVDKSSLPDNYITAKYEDEVVGKYLDLGLTTNAVLTKDNLSLTGKASLIETGETLYAMSDLVNYPQGLVAGDHVNIVVSTSAEGSKFVKTIENVPVAGVHMEEGKITGIEIYVNPQEAQSIAYAQANGQVSVALLPLDYENKNLDVLDDGGFLTSQFSDTTETKTAE